MKRLFLLMLISTLLASGCNSSDQQATSLFPLVADSPAMIGPVDYLASPFATAGDRLYLVGHQNGDFVPLGWHIPGEMGGIWDHPIKLMDGFQARLQVAGQEQCLNQAEQFVNYPYANLHRFPAQTFGVKVERLQFVPDGEEAVVIEYRLTNTNDEGVNAHLHFAAQTDLRPTWLGERTDMTDGPDLLSPDPARNGWLGKDSLNDWYVLWGADRPGETSTAELSCGTRQPGLGRMGGMRYQLRVPAQESRSITFVIAGSDESQADGEETFDRVMQNRKEMLQRKQARYQDLAATASLDLPDETLELAYRWVKYNSDWLIRDVPGIGRGLAAGLPDYPWWFGCDNTYSLQGMLATGRRDIVYSTMALLKKLSEQENSNGRIIHEASTNGAVFNPGNINETPHFASMVWTVYEWTGDSAFLAEYYPLVRRGMTWLLEQGDRDGNLLPDGFGMMEIHGLDSEMIDVAAYSLQGLADAARIAEALGERADADLFHLKANQLSEIIHRDFWVEDFQSYADFIGTTAQARQLVADAIVRADTLDKPWAVAELEATRAAIADLPAQQKRGFVLYHNWVVNTPMEIGDAPKEQAIPALNTARRFINPFGAFVTGIDRDEVAGSDDGSFARHQQVFTYTGAVMTLPTGVAAIAENNYGRPDTALDYLQRMVRSFSYALPGSMYEVSPDFGMFTQAWNVYALAVPLVQQFMGVQPQAYAERVVLRPVFPTSWPEARLSDLPVGSNTLQVAIRRKDGSLTLNVEQSKPSWELVFEFPADAYNHWELNGQVVQPEVIGNLARYRASGRTLSLVLR